VKSSKNGKTMSKKTIIIILLALVAITGQAQTSFDPDEGCLNVIDISYAQGIGEYGDEGVSANYLHEKFINERLSIGAGIGYNHHEKYKFSAIPIYFSTHYFFLDRKFSPFVNLRVGGFAMFNAKKVGTDEKYSLSKDKQSFSLFVSPSVGVKMHITPNIGIMASISDEAYLLNAFDTNKNDYKNKLIHDLGISVGVCFQIKGW
jgi:hypothetical protein